MSAETARLSATPAPLGKPGGPGLFHEKGNKLPNYIEQVAQGLMKNGRTKSQAIQIAIGVVKNWASGRGKVSPEVRAAATKAVAEWEALKAKARATPNLSTPRTESAGVELANAPANAPRKGKPAKGDARSAKYGQPALPPGATHWKHGWVPVNDQGKTVGPAAKPKWLLADEKAQKDAGGKTAAQYRAEAAQKEMAAPGKAAAAKAASAKKHAQTVARTEARAEASAEKKQHTAQVSAQKKATAARTKASKAQAAQQKKAAAEAKRRAAAAARLKAADARKKATAARAAAALAKKDAAAKAKLMTAAYKQAMADKKAGRKLTPAQQKIMAAVTAQQAKTTAALRAGAGLKLSNEAGPRPFDLSRVNVSTVIELAGGGHRMPGGQLAFRYKHGWILINPAIPSRGRGGGGLAAKHGHKSGGVTFGHFENHPSGKGKVFVADRHGGMKPLKGAPHEKSAYTVAAQHGTGHEALGGSGLKHTPAEAEAKSQAAHEASIAAQKAGDAKSAQVAAKKHAEAFVAHKSSGNAKKAETHKNIAQSWQKKVVQLQKADKASAEAAKAKKAEDEKKAADDTKALKEKAEVASDEAFDATTDAQDAPSAATHKHAETMHKAAAKAHTAIGNKLTAANHEEHAADHAAQAAKLAEGKKNLEEAKQLSKDAANASLVAVKEKTEKAHMDAFAAHVKAEKASTKAGKLIMANNHSELADHHAAEAEKIVAAQKKLEEKPKAPALEKGFDANAVLDIAEQHATPDASAVKWYTYLKASHNYKANPTPENMKILTEKQKKLKDAGVKINQLQSANADMQKLSGSASNAGKSTLKSDIQDTANGLIPKEPIPSINLPGPGMFADGGAIKSALTKYNSMPPGPKKDALGTAIKDAEAAFQKKHGVPFQMDKVEKEVGSFVPSYGGHAAEHPFWDSAKAAGFEPVPSQTSANGTWKPTDVPGLKSTAGAYTYSGGSYTGINNQLRHGVGPSGGSYDKTIKQMDREFAAVPELENDIVTIRKMHGSGPFDDIPPYMEPGGIFVDHGYSSTSKEPGVWSGNTAMQVRIPAGSKVLDLNHTVGSQNDGEKEVLLDRDSHYRVISDGPGHDGSGRLIVVELVPGPKKPQST